MEAITLYALCFLLIAGVNCNEPWCIGQNGRIGTCVPWNKCETPQFRYQSWCGGVYGKVCCVRNQYNRPIGNQQKLNQLPTRTKKPKITPKPDNLSAAKIIPPITNTQSSIFPKMCGPVTGLVKPQIFGGSQSQLHEFPWIAVLEFSGNPNFRLRCGGSLINARYVLTAAHCLLPELHSVRLGVHNIKTDCPKIQEDCNHPIQRRRIEEKIKHKYYEGPLKSAQYDIALLRMDKEVQFTDYVKAICLPSLGESAIKPPMTLTVAGWGATGTSNYGKDGNADVLRKVNVPLVQNTKCYKISHNQLCVGGQIGKDSCKGDSGGPLMLREKGYWIIEGVVSFGYSCGNESPAVYTSVRSHLEWIHETVENSNSTQIGLQD